MFRSPHHREFWTKKKPNLDEFSGSPLASSSWALLTPLPGDGYINRQVSLPNGEANAERNQPWLGQKWLENAWKCLNHHPSHMGTPWDLPMKGMKKMIMMGFTTLPNLDGFNHLQVEWEWLMIGFTTSEPWNHFSLQIPDRARVPELSSCKSHSISGWVKFRW